MAEIKQAKFIDRTGQEADAVFVGAEKAIYDDSGKRLDQKLEEREKATGLLASDTQGILGNIGAEVSLQSIIDKVAEKIMRELVSNSSLTQTLANYMTTAMMSGEQIDDGNKVPTSALAFAMNQAITQNKNAITQLNSDLRPKINDLSPELTGKPLETIKKHWSEMPAGVYTAEIQCGSVYGAFVQRLPAGTHGAVFIIGYGVNNYDFKVYTYINGVWS